jgi:dipeptidyl aminopeptidase/acylaminoacyl peptidase
MNRIRFSLLLRVLGTVLLALACALALPAQNGYQKPPKEVLDVLNAAETPQLSLSPAKDVALLYNIVRYPPIAELSQPMLRLAGVRINPATNGPHNPQRVTNLVLKRITDGKEIKVVLPTGAKPGFPSTGTLLSPPSWAPDGKHFAFMNTTSNGIELLLGDSASGAVKTIPGVRLNAAIGGGFQGGGILQWMPDSKTLLCKTVPAGRGNPPAEPRVPAGPNVQENFGRAAPAPTFQDLLQNPHDEDLFDYYARAQLALVDTATGQVKPLGKPAVIGQINPAPGGRFILVTWLKRPYTYQRPLNAFPAEVEVWGLDGAVVYKVASLPLAENVPLGGVITGPRVVNWIPTEPSTLVWAEALDDGDPRKKVPHRDKIMRHQVPSRMMPVEFLKLEHRYSGLAFGERGDFAIVREFDRSRNWTRTYFLDPKNPADKRMVWDMSSQERYKNPGQPETRRLPNGETAILQDGDFIYLGGAGATPEGDRPFLNRMNIKTLETQEIFRSQGESYELVPDLLSSDGSKFLTRYESLTEPPNYYIRTKDGGRQAFTNYPDPAPQLRKIKKELVKYKRADGQDLSFTLYLPPDYKPGERRPAMVWAYPLEFTGADVAGQVSGSSYRFTTIIGPSHLFFLLQGYVILNDASIPIVGDPETVNNTYVEQLVSSAQAAVDKAAAMGVIDPDRVGVAGHSYGAFMTANLLAHSDIFRAGIARSGAYNRTLTPFGFQSERRTIWQAAETYIKMSPFMNAHKLKEPILLIHGEADNNSGTFPIQSERMYAALKGNGGNVRYVTLPHESHGYAARESVEHTLWEMFTWFDKYVKNAPPRQQRAGQ